MLLITSIIVVLCLFLIIGLVIRDTIKNNKYREQMNDYFSHDNEESF